MKVLKSQIRQEKMIILFNLKKNTFNYLQERIEIDTLS